MTPEFITASSWACRTRPWARSWWTTRYASGARRTSPGALALPAAQPVQLGLHLACHFVQRRAGRLGAGHGVVHRRIERLLVRVGDGERGEVLHAGAGDVGEDLEVRGHPIIPLEDLAHHLLVELVE